MYPMRSATFAILATLVWFPLVAPARIGETETACDMRYNQGKPPLSQSFADRLSPLVQGPATTNKTYSYQGWSIKIGFIQGIASRIEYSKAGEGPRAITAEEVNAILNGNGGLRSWRLVAQDQFPNPTKIVTDIFRRSGYRPVWYRQDGTYAYLRPAAYFFRIENGRALQADAAAAKPARSIPSF